MVKYRISGTRNGKKYLSRKYFLSEKSAFSYAYKNLVYNPSGETKRKNQLTNIKILSF